jgi:signal transduction histidine kinase
MSKITAGELSLYVEEGVSLGDEIRAAVDMAAPLLQKQNASLEEPIQFIQGVDDGLPPTASSTRKAPVWGLPISRSMVQAHGGELWMESTPGEGTTFFFTLPFRPPRAMEESVK